jgi:hypothetical protein
MGSFVLIAMNTPVYRRISRGIANCATPWGFDLEVAIGQIRSRGQGMWGCSKSPRCLGLGGAGGIAKPSGLQMGQPGGVSISGKPVRNSRETLNHGRQGTVAAVACCRLGECGRGLRESALGKSRRCGTEGSGSLRHGEEPDPTGGGSCGKSTRSRPVGLQGVPREGRATGAADEGWSAGSRQAGADPRGSSTIAAPRKTSCATVCAAGGRWRPSC